MENREAIEILSGLSQETRLDIYRLLVQRGPEGLPAGRIAERLDLPPPTASFHLAHLQRCGLLEARRAGRSIIYSADFAAMDALMAFLSENCCRESPCCAPETNRSSHGEPERSRESSS